MEGWTGTIQCNKPDETGVCLEPTGVAMPLRFDFNATLECDRETAWRTFADWKSWRNTVVFGDIYWIQGEPWERGSKRLVELKIPFVYRVEQTVVAVVPTEFVSMLGHGAVYTTQVTTRFRDLGDAATEMAVTVEIEASAADFFGSPFSQAVPATINQVLAEMQERCNRRRLPATGT